MHIPYKLIGKKYCAVFCAAVCIGFWIPHFTTYAQPVITTPEFSGRDPDDHPKLTPCSRFDDRYQHLGFADRPLDEWADMYHERVSTVIEEYLEPAVIECDAEDYGTLSEPGGELLDLAASLPTWNDPAVPLSRLDTSRVLLEYLRIYGCALFEFNEFILYDTAEEEYEERGEIDFLKFFFSDLMTSALVRTETIQKEQQLARKALHRAITIMGAFDRLGPLDAELECMQRFSLDMRNISALTAETSACLPRIWNAKDSLRDYKED